MAVWTPVEILWPLIAAPLAAAEDAVARLDERLSKSPIREGWIARTHFTDACASLWIDGELVHIEDLVLHNERMDVRTPTHEIARAHTIFRARRRLLEAEPEWALSRVGLDALRGRPQPSLAAEQGGAADEADEVESGTPIDEVDDDLDLAAEFAALEAAVARSAQTLSGLRSPRDDLVYDPAWAEDEKIEQWRISIQDARDLPPVLAAALALDAWNAIEPLQHMHWLGRLLAAALLRARNKTRTHLFCLNAGLKEIPRARRRAPDRGARLVALLEAFSVSAARGLEDHDRWTLARRRLERKLDGRRSTSRLPALIDYVMARPVASAGMIARELSITPRAAQDLVAELGLREATGKRRYRAWGVL